MNGPQPGVGRDLHDYVSQYRSLPFEPTQLALRRRRVLARVAARSPQHLLEVGCGEWPLFVDLPAMSATVVEPARDFAERARSLAQGLVDVDVIEDCIERVGPERVAGPFDMVVVSSLLHEVPNPQQLLRAVRRLCSPHATVHVNVPNASSLHRRLALAMRLIDDLTATSDTQRRMQQRHVYDLRALTAELSSAGFEAESHGSLLVKPFPHALMQRLLDEKIMTSEMLEGLDRLADEIPELGSEIWVDARLSHD